jgi:hypothetical protein
MALRGYWLMTISQLSVFDDALILKEQSSKTCRSAGMSHSPPILSPVGIFIVTFNAEWCECPEICI